MMWIAGVHPLDVLHAYVARHRGARRDRRFRPRCSSTRILPIRGRRPARGARRLGARRRSSRLCSWRAIATNVVVNMRFPQSDVPGSARRVGRAPGRRAAPRAGWHVLPAAIKGSVFLLALVLCASMMPVEELPAPSWRHDARPRLRLGRVRQHPAHEARARPGRLRLGHARLRGRLRRLDDLVRLVGGRRALDAVPRSALASARWLRHGWHVAVGYVVGFAALYFIMGWHPHAQHRADAVDTAARGRRGRPLMFAALGRFCIRYRWPVIGVYAVLLPVALFFGIPVFKHLKAGGFEDRGEESWNVKEDLEKKIKVGGGDLIAIYTATSGDDRRRRGLRRRARGDHARREGPRRRLDGQLLPDRRDAVRERRQDEDLRPHHAERRRPAEDRDVPPHERRCWRRSRSRCSSAASYPVQEHARRTSSRPTSLRAESIAFPITAVTAAHRSSAASVARRCRWSSARMAIAVRRWRRCA